MPWGYSWGTAGHSTTVLWDYAKFKPGKDSLKRIWPILEPFARFYCSVLEKCPMVDGKRKVGPTYFAEIGEFGVFNSSYDLVLIKFTLTAAKKAATIMGNTKLAERCAANLATLPDYPTEMDPSQGGPVIGQWLGGGLPKIEGNSNCVLVARQMAQDAGAELIRSRGPMRRVWAMVEVEGVE